MKRLSSAAIAVGLALGLGLATAAPSAHAQPVDQSSLGAARELGNAGIEALKRQDYVTAGEKLERAYKIIKAPSLALWSARALEKNGKWVEAAERYLEGTRLEATSGNLATQRQAQEDAGKEREALLPKIPTLQIDASRSDIQLRVDGVVLSAALLGVPRPVNPGAHQITMALGSNHASQTVNIKEGEHQTLKLKVPSDWKAPATSSSGSGAGTKSGSGQVDQPTPGKAQRIAGWSAMGVGGLGLVVGGIAGILVMTKHSSDTISNGCSNDHCPNTLADSVDSYNTARTISTVGFVAGAVGIGTGLSLLLTLPKARPTSSASLSPHISPWIGAGSAGLRGSF